MADIVDLLPWDIAVKSALERRSAGRILDHKDADQIIQGLTELEAYYAVKSLGPDDSTPFLAVLTRDQIRALVDLDVWRGGALAIDDLMVWLSAFREVSMERMQDAVLSLDPEVMGLLFRRRLLIGRKVRDDNGELMPDWMVEPPDEILPLVDTPDGRFVIAARPFDEMDEEESVEEEERKSVIELVLELYKSADYETAAGLLRMGQTDMSSDLEETALRFRDARLEDLGFPSRERAIEVYAGGDPDALVGVASALERSDTGVRLPALFASRLDGGLFHTAMRAVEDPAVVRRIEAELVPLANCVLVADGVEPGDLEAITLILDRVRSNIELALGYSAPAETLLTVARERLEQLPMRRLFAAGHALTVRLASRARTIERKGGISVGARALGLLDDGDRRVMEALLRGKRPLCAIDGDPRAFRAADEVEKTSRVLDAIEAWAEIARALDLAGASVALGDLAEPPAVLERTMGLIIGTLAGRAILGEKPALIPLDAAALGRLARAVAEPDAAQRAARAIAQASGRGTGDEPEVALRVERQVAEIAEALAPFSSGDRVIDPRFVGGLVRARG